MHKSTSLQQADIKYPGTKLTGLERYWYWVTGYRTIFADIG